TGIGPDCAQPGRTRAASGERTVRLPSGWRADVYSDVRWCPDRRMGPGIRDGPSRSLFTDRSGKDHEVLLARCDHRPWPAVSVGHDLYTTRVDARWRHGASAGDRRSREDDTAGQFLTFMTGADREATRWCTVWLRSPQESQGDMPDGELIISAVLESPNR